MTRAASQLPLYQKFFSGEFLILARALLANCSHGHFVGEKFGFFPETGEQVRLRIKSPTFPVWFEIGVADQAGVTYWLPEIRLRVSQSVPDKF
jgi:hypothetical protein